MAQTVASFLTDYNPDTSEEFTTPVARGWLSERLGAGPYTLWACLLLARDREGFTRYSQAKVVQRFRSRQWGKSLTLSVVSVRTIKRWYRVLAEYGLAIEVGRTAGRYRIRKIRGDLGKGNEVEIPGETYAILTRWGRPPAAARRECAGVEVPHYTAIRAHMKAGTVCQVASYPEDPRTVSGGRDPQNVRSHGDDGPLMAPMMAPMMAPHAKPAPAANDRGEGSSNPNPAGPSLSVGVKGIGVKSFSKEKDSPARRPAGEPQFFPGRLRSIPAAGRPDLETHMAPTPHKSGGVQVGPELLARFTAPRLLLPEAMPRDPREEFGEYWGPSRPRVRSEMRLEEKIQWVTRAYSAAVHFHTGKFPGMARGIDGSLRKILTPTARMFGSRMAPHLFAVIAMAWLRDPERSPDKIPPLRQIFQIGFVKKMFPVVSQTMKESPQAEWSRTLWDPQEYQFIREYWAEGLAVIRRAMKLEGMTQAYLDNVSAQIFDANYRDIVRGVATALRSRKSADAYGLRGGRWVWGEC